MLSNMVDRTDLMINPLATSSMSRLPLYHPDDDIEIIPVQMNGYSKQSTGVKKVNNYSFGLMILITVLVAPIIAVILMGIFGGFG